MLVYWRVAVFRQVSFKDASVASCNCRSWSHGCSSGWFFWNMAKPKGKGAVRKMYEHVHPWISAWFTWKSSSGKGNSLCETMMFRFHAKLWVCRGFFFLRVLYQIICHGSLGIPAADGLNPPLLIGLDSLPPPRHFFGLRNLQYTLLETWVLTHWNPQLSSCRELGNCLVLGKSTTSFGKPVGLAPNLEVEVQDGPKVTNYK